MLLQKLATALVQAKEWPEAKRVARSIEDNGSRARALYQLATALAQAKEWQEAKRVALSMEFYWERSYALQNLATALAQAGEREQAQALWREAERVILSISRSSPPPKKKPSSTPPSLGETTHTIANSPEAEVINFTGSVVTITLALIAISQGWSKKHSTNSISSQEHSLQPSKWEVVAIRLRMTHGEHELEEWLTDSNRLKHYINAFNDPSSSIRPLKVFFVQRRGKETRELPPVDVSKGAQNNLQLDELLSYLNIDSAEN